LTLSFALVLLAEEDTLRLADWIGDPPFSIGSSRAWALPALVMPRRPILAPDKGSDGVKPRSAIS